MESRWLAMDLLETQIVALDILVVSARESSADRMAPTASPSANRRLWETLQVTA
jgi:hypothetical protein